MNQTINPVKSGLSARELRQLLQFIPETIAPYSAGSAKSLTAARYWSIERRRKLATDRRRSVRSF